METVQIDHEAEPVVENDASQSLNKFTDIYTQLLVMNSQSAEREEAVNRIIAKLRDPEKL